MTRIACIVEGHGELQALPVLLRRLAAKLDWHALDLAPPIRVPRDRFLNRPPELARMVALAAINAGARGLVLIVLDADDECPMELAATVLAQAAPHLRGAACRVAVANREFEAWLLAAASCLAGKRGLPAPLDTPDDSESIRDAKGWLSERMSAHSGNSYSPVADQAALTAAIDLDLALARSRSLRKLDKCLREFIESQAGTG